MFGDNHLIHTFVIEDVNRRAGSEKYGSAVPHNDRPGMVDLDLLARVQFHFEDLKRRSVNQRGNGLVEMVRGHRFLLSDVGGLGCGRQARLNFRLRQSARSQHSSIIQQNTIPVRVLISVFQFKPPIDSDGSLHQRQRFVQPIGVLEQLRQVVEVGGDFGVLVAVGLLIDGQRAASW
jgi:hypothetical protein